MWPVTLLTSFLTVLEKIIYDRLIKHIQIDNILVQEQLGFQNFIINSYSCL